MKTIIHFTTRKWLRSSAMWTTLVLWCVLSFFALHQRSAIIQKSKAATDRSAQYESSKEKLYYGLLDSAHRQLKTFESYTVDPRNPNYFNRQVPRFAIFKPGPLDVLATGQSDLLPQEFVISARPDFRLQKEEPVSGLQLFYGKLDVAFLLVFILPLIIIAFNYNILSEEKESGTLRLLLVQQRSLSHIVIAKAFVSFVFTLCLLLIPLVGSWAAGMLPFATSKAVGLYFLAGILYSLFWHLLCIVCNTGLRSSGYNVSVLISLWVCLALIYPAVVNMAAELIYPVPSRSNFITAYRTKLSMLEQHQNNEVLDKYFFDHPEMVKQDTTQNVRSRANEFWKAHHINHEEVTKQVQPLFDLHAVNLRRANRFAGMVGNLSPAVSLQYSLLLLAGQSGEQYVEFSNAITEWRKPYLRFVLDKLVREKDMTLSEAPAWKPFYHRPADRTGQVLEHAGVIFLIDVVLLVWMFYRVRLASIV